MPAPTTRSRESARIGALSRSREWDDPELVEARQNLKVLRLEHLIRKELADWPPLSVEHRRRVASLLDGGTR